MKNILFILFVFVFGSNSAFSQVTAADCATAVNICTNANFSISPSGSGNDVDFTAGSGSNPSTNPASTNAGCLLSGELNPTFMIINIATSGTLEFSMGSAGGSAMCFDWICWPYDPATTCGAIQAGTLPPIRCNWNGNCMGFTGIAGTLPAGADQSNFEPPINVNCGDQFLLCLSNYSSATTNVPLNFFGSAQVSCNTFTPITVNSDTICPGGTAQLIATGGNTYIWSPPTGLNSTTNDTVYASPAVTTAYVVEGTGNCGTGTDTAWVVIDPNGQPPTINAVPASNAICSGQNTTITANGANTYQWSPATGLSSTSGATVTASPTSTTTYTVIGTSNCGNDTTTVTIIVNPLPIANAGPDVSICNGTSAQLNASGGTSYLWSPGTGLSDVNIPNPVANPPATTTYTVTVGQNNCFNTDQITVTVSSQFDASITPAGPFCVDAAPLNLSAANTGGTWSGTGITDAANGTFNPAVAGAGTHTITYIINGACGDTATSNIVVNALPVMNISVDQATGCSPLAVNISNNTPGLNACTWMIDGQPAGNDCALNAQAFTTPGCYDVTFTAQDANGCANSFTVNDMVCVYANPIADFSFSPNNPTVLAPTVQFNNLSINASNYNWNFGGLGTSTAVNPTFDFPETLSGTFDVCLQVSNQDGCADSICKPVTVLDELVVFAPNAFSPDGNGQNEIFLPFVSGHAPDSYELRIFNRWGELIFESNSEHVGWDGTHHSLKAKNDVYVWKIKVKKISNGERKEIIGHVTLIR